MGGVSNGIPFLFLRNLRRATQLQTQTRELHYGKGADEIPDVKVYQDFPLYLEGSIPSALSISQINLQTNAYIQETKV